MDAWIQDFLQSAASWRQTVIDNIPNIIIALLVLVVAFFLDDRAQRAVERIVGSRNGQREIGRLLGRMARIGVLVLALLVILSIFQLSTIVTSFVASLGIAGLVVAFALQDITKNFAAGVLLLILRPFRLDDRIKVKDFEGVVTDISLRATTLRTNDGDEVLVPNADVYINPIVNLTRYRYRRYHVPLSIPLSLPSEPVRRRLEATLAEIPGVLSDPAPRVLVTAASGDSLTLDAQFWIASGSTEATQVTAVAVERLTRLVEAIKQRAAEQRSETPA